MTDANYVDDLALLANTPAKAKSLLLSLEQIKQSSFVLNKKVVSPLYEVSSRHVHITRQQYLIY